MQINFLPRLAAFMIFLLVSHGSIAADRQQKDLEIHLQKSFDLIYLATNGLEYPGAISDLKHCIKYNDKECLRTYKLVLKGKKMIKSVSSMKALDTTLDIIERACLSKDEHLANFTCGGGILSLYFYTSPEQDAKILNRIKIYPKKVKNIIFFRDFYWFYNRPNKDAWISAITAMDIDWEYGISKEVLLTLFKKDIAEIKDKTWIAK